MTSAELLVETQKAAGQQALSETHAELITNRKEEKQLALVGNSNNIKYYINI
jgi:hypothetical protein